jgi:N-acetylglucosaminyl-diphospho-decaprenol L-rhamnosyltransferase
VSVLVVIVNFRTPALAIDCLRSLQSVILKMPDTRVAIVDNASGDGSYERIAAAIEQRGWRGWARVADSGKNGGFAAGTNLALRQALSAAEPPDFFWFLNPDTLVDADSLDALVDFMSVDPAVGIAGSRIDDPAATEIGPIAFRFPSLISEVDAGLGLGAFSSLVRRWSVVQRVSDRAECVDWVCGASMLVRRQVFADVGLLDEGYFLYFEETDFCLQAARAGWACWYVPTSRVTHFAGSATGVSSAHAVPTRRPRYWFDSRRRYFIKNHSRLYAALVDLAWLGAHLTRRARNHLGLGRGELESRQYLQDFLSCSALRIGRERRTVESNSGSRHADRPAAQ